MSMTMRLPMTDEQRDQIERFRDTLTDALEIDDLMIDGLRSITVERRLAVGEIAMWKLTVEYPDIDENGHKYVAR